MRKRSIWIYVFAVLLILGVINLVASHIDPGTTVNSLQAFTGGFIVGMLAMYIAVHIYRWK